MFVVARISDEVTARACASLTFPCYIPALLAAPSTPEIVAVVATYNDAPIGLGLAGLTRGETQASLLSLAVAAAYRRQGVATALLSALMPQLGAAGADGVHAIYTAGQPSTPAVERLLQRSGFSPPQPRNLLCTAEAQILRAPVLGAAELPAGATIGLWLGVSASERARLRDELAAHVNIPKDVGPFCYEQDLLPAFCFALRYQNRVIGWALSQAMDSDTVRIVSSYVLPEYQGGAFYPCLQVRLIETAFKLGRSRATWTVGMEHQELIRYHRLYLLPYLARCDESRAAQKHWSVPK